MKGLLIKDFKLLKNQLTILFVIAIIAGVLVITNYDPSFIIGYLTSVYSIFVLSTISYDELDNGNAFLFTLPFSRKLYVVEKYIFGIIMGLIGWALATFGGGFYLMVKTNTFSMLEWFTVASSCVIILLFCLAIMIPFQLKFGAEKGRIALFVVVFALIGISSLVRLPDGVKESFLKQVNMLSNGALIGIGFLIAFIVLFLSMAISIRIQEKKEF